MYLTTDDFIDELKVAHTMYAYAAILHNGFNVINLPITGGMAHATYKDAIRRDFDLTIVDSTGTWAPDDVQDLLMPFGTEIALYRGVRYVGGATEVCPWGVYRLNAVDISESDEGLTIEASGFDRAYMVQQPSPRSVSVRMGTKFEEAIERMVAARAPFTLQTRMEETGYETSNHHWPSNTDLWEEARLMAEAVGCDLFFDVEGYLTMVSTVGQYDVTRIIRYEAGNKNAISISKSIAADGLPNGVIYTGKHQHTDEAIARGEAWDLNPMSPMYRHGSYGEVIQVEETDKVLTTAQAQRAAEGMLERELGPYETVTIEAIPNPCQDVGDIIYAKRSQVGVDGYYVITNIDMPLSPEDTMTIAARKRIAQ